MPKIYLLGGENVARKSAKEINAVALEDAGVQPRVAVFAWARPGFDSRYSKRKLFRDYLRGLGAGEVDFVEFAEKEDLRQRLSETNLVYLTGGQASVLIERAKAAGLDDLLKRFSGVIVGRSAGALALCKRCVTTIREGHRVHMVEGLGVVDVTLKAHYIGSKDETLKRFSSEEEIVAVPKDSALVWNDGHFIAIGDVFVFLDGRRYAFDEALL